ncbi:hypothetical protein [Streptomyces sp. NPDC055400]
MVCRDSLREQLGGASAAARASAAAAGSVQAARASGAHAWVVGEAMNPAEGVP